MITIHPNTLLKDLNDTFSFSCKSGFCGQCKSTLISGKVLLTQTPIAILADDEILPCCCKSVTTLLIKA
ncbi:2Fe-2S iron-sulfur cluster-binding protein [Shewanella sp. SG41-4]